LFYEDTPVPGATTTWTIAPSTGHTNDGGSAASSANGGSRDSSVDAASLPMMPMDGSPRKSMSGDQVKKDESKKKKILVRVVVGFGMFFIFAGSVRVVERRLTDVGIQL
jgi:hypothetical protein